MSAIGEWAFLLFFLWFGLSAFISALNTSTFKKIGAVLAIIVGVVKLLGALGIGM